MSEAQLDLEYVVEDVPMPQTRAGVLEALKRILAKPFVQEITLKVDAPIQVSWHKAAGDTLLEADVYVSLETTLLSVEMVDLPRGGAPKELLLDAMLFVSQRGLFPTHVAVSSARRLCDLFGLPWSVELRREELTEHEIFGGLRVIGAEQFLDDDQVIVIGTPLRDSHVSDAKLAVRFVP